MSKLSFFLNPNCTAGINFNTRYGASITLLPGQYMEYGVREDDELTLQEQVDYYKQRYASRGLVVGIVPKIDLPEKKSFERVVSEVTSVEAAPVVEEQSPVEESSIVEEILAAEEIPAAEEDLDSLSYAQLRAKAEELGITIEGRESKVSLKEKIQLAGK